ncbi:MAG: hypothetical protein ACYCO4_00635 [Sulfobacillus sp.]
MSNLERQIFTRRMNRLSQRRAVLQRSTCPNCFLTWQAQDPWRAFASVVVCPECGTASLPARGDRRIVDLERGR